MTLKTMSDLVEYVSRATQQYRPPGMDVVTETDQATVYMGFPATDDASEETRARMVDVFFTQVEVWPTRDGGEEWTTQDLYDTIALNPVGEFNEMGADSWMGGPSYIEIGGWIGSQDLALRLLALGEYHGLWQVVTPKTLFITGPEADQLAGLGMVMASGLTNPLVETKN